MFLSRVQIENFRNLKRLSAEFSDGLNVIVGENNVGKTNLLDAIRIALGPSSTGEFIRLTPFDRHRTKDGVYVTDPISIVLTFAGLSADEQGELLDILNYNAETPERSTATIHLEWVYSEKEERAQIRRWGGERTNSESPVPEDILEAIPLTLLTAMRDALSALVPGRTSRLGRVLKVSAADEHKKELTAIITEANKKLHENELVTSVETRIKSVLDDASGLDLSQIPAIRAADPEFDRIVNSLRLLLKQRGTTADGEPIYQDLSANGLGYNNLLFIGTVLAELEKTRHAALPLLFVEEPEAHLHPQLQTLLADFLARHRQPQGTMQRVQTLVTTHSPTIAAHVNPRLIRVLHGNTPEDVRCVSLDACGLDAREAQQLRRMFDVTRASLLFARGVILVEGVSEALLLPVLARRLGLPLEDRAVSVIPVAGVDFATLAKLFGDTKLRLPVSIVTDGDPKTRYPPKDKERLWKNALVSCDKAGRAISCKRLNLLLERFGGGQVRVEHSKVTLEHELALAGDKNAETLYDAWASCYVEGPDNLRREDLIAEPRREMRAILLWRALCVASPSHGKAELAQALAEALEKRDATNAYSIPDFTVPAYLERAIKHARGVAV